VAKLKFAIRVAEGTQRYFWRIMDGEDILARSETMVDKRSAIAAANKMKFNTEEYEFEVFRTKEPNYPYSWHAQAGNSRLLVSSTNLYNTHAGADQAKNYVKLNAPYAEVVDETVAVRRW
jgi:uncharacterized protein YegP (UPF0339 family)